MEGSCDVAVTAMDNVISWSRDTCCRFKIIGQIERSTRLMIYARPGLKSLGELGGARLAVDAPDSGMVLALRGAIEQSGVGAGDYSLLPLGGVKERLEALIGAHADAGLMGPPLDAAAEAAGLRKLGEIEEFFPDYPGLGLVVREDRLEPLHRELSAYVSALHESLQWMQTHPLELIEALVSAGFARERTQMVLDTRTTTLLPSREGIQRILTLRERFDPVMDSKVGYTDLVDLRFQHESPPDESFSKGAV